MTKALATGSLKMWIEQTEQKIWEDLKISAESVYLENDAYDETAEPRLYEDDGNIQVVYLGVRACFDVGQHISSRVLKKAEKYIEREFNHFHR